jgi:hypothetical protein
MEGEVVRARVAPEQAIGQLEKNAFARWSGAAKLYFIGEPIGAILKMIIVVGEFRPIEHHARAQERGALTVTSCTPRIPSAAATRKRWPARSILLNLSSEMAPQRPLRCPSLESG